MSDYKIEEKEYKSINKSIKIVFLSAEFNANFIKDQEKINKDFLEKKWFTNIEHFTVPWAYEIPWFLSKVLKSIKPDLVICFWVVIRWETTHYEMVAWESARWIMDLSLNTESAIINAILTCENEEQVIARISDTYALSWLNLLEENNKLEN